MFQQLQVFLQHQKGDYLQTVKYLEHMCQAGESEGKDLLKLLLIEAYLGIKLHDAGSLQSKMDQVCTELGSGAHIEVLVQAKSLIELSDSANVDEIKQRTEQLIAQFKDNPRKTCSQLLLMQELCLDRKVLPDANVLDLAEDVTQWIEQLNLPE